MHDFERRNPGRHGRFLAVALMVAVAGCARTPGTTGAASPPTAVSEPSPTPASRSHVLSDTSDRGGSAIGITVTIPDGWSGEPGGWAMETGPSGFDPPDGAGIIAFTVDKEFYVYGDPCEWKSTRPKKPATTVDDLAAALANQPSRNASAPEDITVDRYAGKKVTLHVPDDAVFSDCDEGNFATFGVAGEDPALYVQGPGEIDEIWIVDVNGRLVVLDGGYYAGTPQDSVDELHAIVSSATFD
jgi:hypothetical protein